MNVSAMNTTAYAVPQNAAKQPQTAERVQGAQAVDAAKAPAAKEAGAAFDVKISDAAREKAAEKVAADQDAPAKNGKTKGLTADEVKALQDDIDNSYNILIKTMTEQNAKLQAWQADGTGFLNFDGRKVLTAQFALPDVATTPEDAKKAIADGGDWSVNAVADRIMNIATSIAGDDPKKLETLRVRMRRRRTLPRRMCRRRMPQRRTPQRRCRMQRRRRWAHSSEPHLGVMWEADARSFSCIGLLLSAGSIVPLCYSLLKHAFFSCERRKPCYNDDTIKIHVQDRRRFAWHVFGTERRSSFRA